MKMTKIITFIAIAVSVLTIDFLIRVYNDFFSRFSLQDTYNFFGIIAAIASPIGIYFLIKTFKEQKRSNDINSDKGENEFFSRNLLEIQRVNVEFQEAINKINEIEFSENNFQTILKCCSTILYTLSLFLISHQYFDRRILSKQALFLQYFFYKVHFIDSNFLHNKEVDSFLHHDPKLEKVVRDTLRNLKTQKEDVERLFDELIGFYGKTYL